MAKRAIFMVTVAGTNITAPLLPVLHSLTVTDNAGTHSDTANLDIDDTDGRIILPQKGAPVIIALGWEGGGVRVVFTGTVDEVKSSGGTKEVPGRGSNAAIDGFFRDAGYPGYRDDTSWCAAFVGAVMVRAGYLRLADLTARSGRYYGQKLDGPKVGCIVVFWRESPSSWKGHIGFVTGIDWNKKTLLVLGGNQSDAVTEATFAMSKVLAYRWPVAATVKALKSAGSKEAQLLDAAKKIVVGTGVVALGAETSEQAPSLLPAILPQFETLSAVLARLNDITALIAGTLRRYPPRNQTKVLSGPQTSARDASLLKQRRTCIVSISSHNSGYFSNLKSGLRVFGPGYRQPSPARSNRRRCCWMGYNSVELCKVKIPCYLLASSKI